MALSWERIYSQSRATNVDESPMRIMPEGVMVAQNASFDEGGNIGVRQGLEPVLDFPIFDSTGTLELRVRGLFALRGTDDNVYTIAFAGTQAYLVDKDNRTYTSKQTGLTEDQVWSGTNFNGTFYFANGTDEIQSYNPVTDTWGDTSAVTNLSIATLGEAVSFIISYQNQLFVGPVNNNHVRFSPFSNAQQWNGTDAWLVTDDIAFGSQDISEKSVLTGGVALARNLYFTTDDQVYVVRGTSRSFYSVDATDTRHGCVTHNTIRRIGNTRAIWLSKLGFVLFDGYRTEILSNNLERYWRSINTSRLNFACAAYYQGNIINREWYICWVTLKDESTTYDYNNFAFLYDIENDSWFTITGWNSDCCTVGEDSAGLDQLFFGTKEGLVMEADKYLTSDDNGYAIDFDLVIGPITSNLPLEYRKSFRRVNMWYGSRNRTTLSVQTTANFQDFVDSSDNQLFPLRQSVQLVGGQTPHILDGVQYDQADVWQSYKVQQKVFGINSNGETMYIRFSNSEVGKSFYFHGWSFGAYIRGQRGRAS